jgi:hypothetical protein
LINILKMIKMGLIKEPLDVDFVVDSRPLTDEDKRAISAFIQAHKAKVKKSSARKTKVVPKSKKKVV